jgi:hypothetical protein
MPYRPEKERGMERYRNLEDEAGIVAYELGEESITVQFTDGSRYLYTYQRTGSPYVEHMKALAIAGRGLNSFLHRSVGIIYAAKLR